MNKPGDGDARHVCMCGHERHEGLCGKPRYSVATDLCRCEYFIDARIGLEKPAPCESLDSRNTRLLAEARKAR
jgi:hypothetical protein